MHRFKLSIEKPDAEICPARCNSPRPTAAAFLNNAPTTWPRTMRNHEYGRRAPASAWDRSGVNYGSQSLWIFGIHAVAAALLNPARRKRRLVLTQNAAAKLAASLEASGMRAQIMHARRFPAPVGAGTVHQGAALEVEPLQWPTVARLCERLSAQARLVILDRVSDPHNVGAVLRSAAAFGAAAVIAPGRHTPPETGALAKSASGALESVPYLRVANLVSAMKTLQNTGVHMIGFDAAAKTAVGRLPAGLLDGRIGLALGSEGVGLRVLTRKNCDTLCRLCSGSLNVSNAAAVALYATAAAGPD